MDACRGYGHSTHQHAYGVAVAEGCDARCRQLDVDSLAAGAPVRYYDPSMTRPKPSSYCLRKTQPQGRVGRAGGRTSRTSTRENAPAFDRDNHSEKQTTNGLIPLIP
jgi:hypothetical protein